MRPAYGVIRSRRTGVAIEISLAGPLPAGGYVPASTVETCDAGVWVSGVVEFSPPILANKFMDEFGDFDFIFVYDGSKEFRRHFSKREIRAYLKRWDLFFADQKRRSLDPVKVKTAN